MTVGENIHMRAHDLHQPGRVFTLLLAVLVASACEVNLNTEGLTARESRTFNVTSRPDVVVETFEGSVEIHSWDRAQVEIEIERRGVEQRVLDEMTVHAEQEGDRIVVRVSAPKPSEFHGISIGENVSPSARLRVALPRESNVDAKSGDGSIAIEDVAGTVVLTTGDGSVRVTRVIGALRVRSGDGSIRMQQVEGELDLETRDGSIGLEARPTLLKALTGDGSVRLQVDPRSVMAGDWDVRTDDGSVVLTLPSEFNAELDAESGDGHVRTSHPRLANQAGDRREERRVLRATMGTGGPTLRIRTGDGSIRIES